MKNNSSNVVVGAASITLKQAQALVRSLGLRLKYSAEYAEYTVVVPHNRAADYFTNDRADAVATAQAMARRVAQ